MNNTQLEIDEKNGSNQYRVLARRYRPKTFKDLIGQDAMVRILSNSFELNRVAHAFLFNGVRGVGKTTTARIVSKGLNCIKNEKPTIDPCGECESCIAAKNDRHVDIIEIDAASHTGVDDMRELTEGVRYKPSVGRYRIYIIDEVHMLSTAAFNALLKTLEEPPEHTKFIFCTTEIRKIPVTVLSRCQKFDLRRVSNVELVKHLKNIAENEKVLIDVESLNLIVRSSDGSVRDALSLLDQAISISNNDIKEESVKTMLGLSDKSKVWDLFDSLMEGNSLNVINNFESLLNAGSDPILLIEELMVVCHNVTRAIAIPSLDASQNMSEFEAKRALKSATNLNIPSVTKCWQLLLKGHSEIQATYSVKEATEMILLRITYAANLPDLKNLIEQSNLLKKKTDLNSNNTQDILTQKVSHELISDNKFETFEDLLYLVKANKELSFYTLLIDSIRVIEYKPYYIKLSFVLKEYDDILKKIRKSLLALTKNNWRIEVVENEIKYNSISEKTEIDNNAVKNMIKDNLLVKSIIDGFENSKIIEIKKNK
ncbi:MAG TPA: DNA polymerase III subunit gamma/tau [Alphaproteobacteria bacterium]|nr:DNA polymerase III subunit gamma/tau [Alphaproteobacteria bacterium]